MSSKRVTVLAKSVAEMQLKDAPQKHEVPQKNLLSPDARRISNIIEKCIAQAKLAVNLPAIIEWISVSGVVIDEKFRRAIERHNILTERLESAWEQKEEDRTLAKLKQDYKNTVMDLLRLIRAHPHVISGWEAQPPIELGEDNSAIIRRLEEFHNLMVERMLTSEEPEDNLTEEEEVELKQLIRGEEKMAAAIKELDEKIAQKAIELEELDRKKKPQLAVKGALQAELRQPVITTTERPDLELRRLQKEADQTQHGLDTLICKHKDEERVLVERNKKVERQIEELLRDFDRRMVEMTAKIEENKKGLEGEEEEMRQLDKPFAELEAEYNKVMEKRRLAEEKRREEQMDLELKTKAAIIGQAWWRGYSTRKALKNESKSKNAPKKGKGKKKKQ